MRKINERPVCHRAEDLVTYLYGEASEVDSRDFADHMQQCDACRVEFGIFRQVHDSILVWRNEALGSAASPAAVSSESPVDSTQFVQHKSKLSALEALREFFSVSPFWLRTATGFALLLLCVLGVLAISRVRQPAAPGSGQNVVADAEFQKAVKSEVDRQVAQIKKKQTPADATAENIPQASALHQQDSPRREMARNAPQRPRGLSRQEREQLAADLRLIPRDEDELPFVLSDEPNQ